jgi:hypothetical protein
VDGFAAEVDLSEPIKRFATLVAAARALGRAPRTVAYYAKVSGSSPRSSAWPAWGMITWGVLFIFV